MKRQTIALVAIGVIVPVGAYLFCLFLIHAPSLKKAFVHLSTNPGAWRQVGPALLARPRLLTLMFALVALDALAVWWLRHYQRRRPGGFRVITEASDRLPPSS